MTHPPTRRISSQGDGVRGHHQEGPHAAAGCRADDAWPGVQRASRLCRMALTKTSDLEQIQRYVEEY
jgi:hypothetical protein